MQKIHDDALEVFRRKNADYGDSFATYGIIGILIRIEDKLRRAISISKNGVNLVKDEGISDTLLDLHNYAAMGLILLDEEWYRDKWYNAEIQCRDTMQRFKGLN